MHLLTLTTSPYELRDYRKSWHTLVERMRRHKMSNGYYRVVEFTKAGYPHLHIIIRSDWPVGLLRLTIGTWWQEIHGAEIVHLRDVRTDRGMAAYVAKYLQKDDKARYSWSWWWVWPGWTAAWRGLVRGYVEDKGYNWVKNRWSDLMEVSNTHAVIVLAQMGCLTAWPSWFSLSGDGKAPLAA